MSPLAPMVLFELEKMIQKIAGAHVASPRAAGALFPRLAERDSSARKDERKEMGQDYSRPVDVSNSELQNCGNGLVGFSSLLTRQSCQNFSTSYWRRSRVLT